MDFFLVHIFLYSVRIQENTDQKKLRVWALFTQCLQNNLLNNDGKIDGVTIGSSLAAGLFKYVWPFSGQQALKG